MLEAGYTIVRLIQRFPGIGLPGDEPHVPVGEEKQSVTIVVASADGCRVNLGSNI